MRTKRVAVLPVALAFVMTLMTAIPASAQNASNVTPVTVPLGEKRKIQGVVSMRTGDTFKVREPNGAETTVLITGSTKVSSHSRGLRGKKEYPVTFIMRGLRVQSEGRGDSEGNLAADWVRFDEQDLRSAQALEQTDALAKENADRLAAAEQAAREAAEEARRMAGQIAENTALAQEANAKAEAAQRTADQAFKDAALANNRINGLDDYEAVRATTVNFKLNSSVLDAAAKQVIDDTAAWAKEERAKGNANGWLVQVMGFADTTGKTAKNKALSEKRAQAVIEYLVLKHGMDLRRLVQPFGYGVNPGKPGGPRRSGVNPDKPGGPRRVEIIILQNKGIAMKG